MTSEVVRDTRRFSSMFGELINETEPLGGSGGLRWRFAMVETLLTQDPPRHKTYRSLVNGVFSQKRIAGMREYVEAITRGLIDSWIDDGEVDLLNRFCVPLPIFVIADQLGVPREEHSRLKRWSAPQPIPWGSWPMKRSSSRTPAPLSSFSIILPT